MPQFGNAILYPAFAQDINAAAWTAIDWDNDDVSLEGPSDVPFEWDEGQAVSRIYLNSLVSSATLVKVEVCVVVSGSVVRSNQDIRVRKNGTTNLRGAAKMGYIRAASGHNESSYYFVAYDPSPTQGDYYEVVGQRIGGSGTVNTVPDETYVRFSTE